MKGIGIRGKFLLLVLLPVIAGFLALEIYTLVNTTSERQAQITSQLDVQNSAFTEHIDGIAQADAMIPQTLSASDIFVNKSFAEINATLYRFVSSENATLDAYVAYNDQILIDNAVRDLANGGITMYWWNTTDMEYRTGGQVWWDPVASTHQFAISEPYFDTTFTKEWEVSFCQPIFLANGTFEGLVGVDVLLSDIQTYTAQEKVGVNGFSVLVSQGDNLIAYPDQNQWGNSITTVFGKDTPLSNAIINNNFAQQDVVLNGTDYTVNLKKVPSVDWIALEFYPDTEITTPIYQSLIIQLVIATIIAVIITCFVMFASTSMTKPISNLGQMAQEIADGNLTANVSETTRTDEIGLLVNDFNRMKSNLSLLVGSMQESSERLSSASEELATSSEEVSSSSENVAATQQQITKGAQSQASMVVEAQKLIQNLSAGIKDIKHNADEIKSVVDLITSIANQTNLLALNAAIEAARAGEAGRGFTVVADQVRKLADESKQAVKRTVDMVSQIVRVSEVQEKSAVEVVNAVDSIATVAEETSASTEEASAAAEEQASSMEEITSTAQSLTELAENLRKRISTFTTSAKDKETSAQKAESNKVESAPAGPKAMPQYEEPPQVPSKAEAPEILGSDESAF